MTINEYFNYLLNIVGGREKYSRILRELYKIDYYSTVPNDDNRGSDGLMLREDFIDDRGHHALSYFDNRPCSVLEMLIALAQRLEFEVAQTDFEKTPKEWFWILINNLGLSKVTNESVGDYPKILDQVHTTVLRMLSRSYAPNGDGGLFPLNNAKRDQRGVEIWYQMTEYLMENYSFL